MQAIIKDISINSSNNSYLNYFATRDYDSARGKYFAFVDALEDDKCCEIEFYDYIANPETARYFETAISNIDWEDEEADEEYENIKKEFENWLKKADLKDIQWPTTKGDYRFVEEIKKTICAYNWTAVKDYYEEKEQE